MTGSKVRKRSFYAVAGIMQVVGLVLLMVGLIAGPAAAHSQGWDDVEDPPFEPHPHALLIGVDLATGTFARCIDLAAGQVLPKANQHNQVHQGQAGEALIGGGNVVAPFTCAMLPL